MNNWSSEEKACVLKSMLRDSAAAILENLSWYGTICVTIDEIKRLKAFDQLQKVEKGCDQAKDKNAMLKQMITQLAAENAYKNKNLDNVPMIKEDKSKLRERLAQLETENKKLKLDSGNAFDDAKRAWQICLEQKTLTKR
nr:unnamed protein product [Callosobruchus chinensis]